MSVIVTPYARILSIHGQPPSLDAGIAALRFVEFCGRVSHAVPFEGQEKRWPATAQHQYQFLLSRAWNVHLLHRDPPRDDKHAATLLNDRNRWMVDMLRDSGEGNGYVLALWDGGSGGTCNCVQYAKSQGHEVINVWDEWKEFSGIV